MLAACLAVALVVVAGCGDGRPTRVPVSGQVLIDGQPLKYGIIRFVPANARPAGGKLDTEGRFSLTCFEENDGATLGTHRIEIEACEPLSGTKFLWHAPKKYSEGRFSGLTQTIDGPKDNLVINLSWDGGKPFIEVDRGEPEGGGEEQGPPGRRRQ
jgi:hypothetical protein